MILGDFVLKTKYNADKNITTLEFNTLAAGVFNASLEQVNLVRKTDFDNTVSILDSKIATNKTKQWVYCKWVE